MRRHQSHIMGQAEQVAATPLAQPPKTDPEARQLREASGLQYELLGSPYEDAKLLSGPRVGQLLTAILKTTEGRDYLGGIWRVAPKDLKDLLSSLFDKT